MCLNLLGQLLPISKRSHCVITMNTVFFWGCRDKDKGFLSNFYQTRFTDNGTTYCSSEQYFMKKKQEMFDPSNEALSREIMQATAGTKIKALGRRVKNFDEAKWNTVKAEIMTRGILLKFSQNVTIRNLLIATGDSILAEAAPRDKIWGIGLSETAARQLSPEQWPGQNLLGRSLMQVRTEISSLT